MRNIRIRSGLVALMALSGLLIGAAGGAQAAAPAAKHSVSHYGYAPGSNAHRKCHPSDPYHKVAAASPITGAKARRYCPPVGSSPSTYSLTVTNNSTHFQDLVVYQKPRDLGVPNGLSLAWLTVPAWPNTTVKFTWTPEYSFVWSQTGTLKPGVTFQAQQIQAADPQNENTNHTQLDYGNGAFHFVDGGVSAGPGTLSVRELSSVPPDTASVGFGMSGSPTFAVQAQPNINLVFTPHPDYWVSAGTFTQGEALDLEQITNEANLPFDGTFNMTAVLDATGNWTVQSSQG